VEKVYISDEAELVGDQWVMITAEATVPLGHKNCSDVKFRYSLAQSDVLTDRCDIFFKEADLHHTIKLGVQPYPGCNKFSSLIEFKPYSETGVMWTNYAPDNITVSKF